MEVWFMILLSIVHRECYMKIKNIVSIVFVILAVIFSGCAEKVENIDATWKTYENTEFGYSFQHPEKFSIMQPLAQGYTGGNIIVEPEVAYITVYVVTTPHPELKREPDLMIDGYPAVLTPLYGEFRSGVSIYKGENLINIYLQRVDKKTDKPTDDLARKIISTIKLN